MPVRLPGAHGTGTTIPIYRTGQPKGQHHARESLVGP